MLMLLLQDFLFLFQEGQIDEDARINGVTEYMIFMN